MGLVLSTTAKTRPHGIKGGFQLQRQENERGERGNGKDSVERLEEGAIPNSEEADRAWNASLVPASIT